MYARDTNVSSERSRSEIESTLRRYGATSYAYASKESAAMIEFQAAGKRVRFILPMPAQDEERFKLTGCMGRSGHSKDRHGYHSSGCFAPRSEAVAYDLWEQATRQRWRALNLVIKAKLEAVEANITTMEEEFLAHIVLPNGKTAGQSIIPQINEAYATGKVVAIGWEGSR